jgi:hypothetical protein
MRKTIIKRLAAVFILFVSVAAVSAQESKHEVSVSVAGGLSTLDYEPAFGDHKNGIGGNIGIGYTYFISENFGLSAGAELSLYKAELSKDKFNNVTRSLVDKSDGELYDFYSSVRGYREKQETVYLNIPVMVQFQYGGKNKLYAQAGVKIGIPASGKYNSSVSETVNKGFFHDTQNWGETQEFMGFGTFAGYSDDGDVDLNVVYILSAELGMKWKLNDKMSVYTGAYVDYGMNDIIKGGRSISFTKFEETPEAIIVKNNSILNSSIGYGSNTLTQTLTDKVTPVAVGLKVRLALGL